MNYKIRVKPLDRVFRRGCELDARIARVAVLYEDLRLENLAMVEESIPTLDLTGREFRRSYFLRRSIATLYEFSEALLMLENTAGFETVKARFSSSEARDWSKSIRFFNRRGKRLADFRNDFGGHFGYRPSWFAVNNLNDASVVLELASDSVRRKASVRFKFVSELVSIGMRRHARVADVSEHFRSMLRLSLGAYGHSARCAHQLAVHDLWARFD
jgi:hypothetical protein